MQLIITVHRYNDMTMKIITENLILPLGSQLVRDNMKDDQNIRSILLYGPTGCGKVKFYSKVGMIDFMTKFCTDTSTNYHNTKLI